MKINLPLKAWPLLLILVSLLTASCKKFLDEKPDKKLAVPSTLQDLRLMLDYYGLFNSQYPAGGEIASDDYYLATATWAALPTESYRAAYLWLPDDASTLDWLPGYQRIYTANVVLQEAERVQKTRAGEEGYKTVRGTALFLRAVSYFSLSQLFAKPYDAATAATDLGLPLRLDPDFTKTSVRSSLQKTYAAIIDDLKEAANLLPVQPEAKSRPSKPAAYAALARLYLSMREYDKAGAYADSCLQHYATVLNYNTQAATATFPFPLLNTEVIWDAGLSALAPLAQSRWRVDSVLYNSYAAADLRKSLFFKSNGDGSYTFRGSYQGSATPFYGFATNEMFLTRAEARARAGQTTAALDDLNALLVKRWRTGAFVPVAASSPAQALALVLAERRKELLFRGLRWTDIRRLSSEPAFAVTPQRVINNTIYNLPIGSPRYLLLIPKEVIEASGMQQNPR